MLDKLAAIKNRANKVLLISSVVFSVVSLGVTLAAASLKWLPHHNDELLRYLVNIEGPLLSLSIVTVSISCIVSCTVCAKKGEI